MWIEEETWLPDTGTKRDVGVLSYGAYNALGLIGSTMGGVAIVHRDPNFVIGTKVVPYDPNRRRELHTQVVETLKEARDPMDCITRVSALGGFDMRFE